MSQLGRGREKVPPRASESVVERVQVLEAAEDYAVPHQAAAFCTGGRSAAFGSKALNLLKPKFPLQPAPYVVVGAFVFLYLQLFILPHTPLFLSGNDQSIYLLDATRMLEGQVLYRDFFNFTPPGTESVYFVLFKLFGARAWIPGGVVILLGVSLTWLCIVISNQLMSGAAAFLPALLLLTFPFSTQLDGGHAWFSTLGAIAALAVTLKARSPARLIAAGALSGLSAWFTQSEGLMALLGLAFFLFWERRRKQQPWRLLVRAEGCLFGTFAAMLAALNAYFVARAGIKQFIYCTMIFVAKYYRYDRYNTWRVYGAEPPVLHSWFKLGEFAVWLFIHILVPLVYILFFVRERQERAARPEQPWERLMLVNCVGLFLFLGVAPAPSISRLAAVCLPALVLLGWFLTFPGKIERVVGRLLWAAALAIVIVEPVARQTRWRATLDLPVGRAAFVDPSAYDEYRWVSMHSLPSQYFFGDEGISFALGLRNPARVNFITANEYTTRENVRGLIEALEKHRAPLVLWSSQLDYVSPRPGGNHLGPLQSYLRSRYHVAKTFGNCDQVWERNDSAR